MFHITPCTPPRGISLVEYLMDHVAFFSRSYHFKLTLRYLLKSYSKTHRQSSQVTWLLGPLDFYPLITAFPKLASKTRARLQPSALYVSRSDLLPTPGNYYKMVSPPAQLLSFFFFFPTRFALWLRSIVVSVLTTVTGRMTLMGSCIVTTFFALSSLLTEHVHSLEHCVLCIALFQSDASIFFIIFFA